MRVISLFSGAGGFDLGMIQAGHEIVWANDVDFDAVATYKNNIGNHIILDDIANISVKDIPQAEIVIGGFPCQGFSNANLNKIEKDDRNELYKYFCAVVRDKMPYYFLAENVRGILSLNGGSAIEAIVSDFESIGYHIQYKLLNSADYGVPQARQRVIIVGTRKDIFQDYAYKYPEPTHAKKASIGMKEWLSIGKALENIPEPENNTTLANHICSKYKVTNRNFTGHRKTDPNKPSPTILARGNGGGGVCAIQHPNNHRRMSVRESAIAQSFPNDFIFHGSLGSCYRQVGNAVAVLFAKRLGSQFPITIDKEL